MTAADPTAGPGLADRIGATWTRFWFTPARPETLAAVRILGGLVALGLWLSYAADLEVWFGPDGMISPELVSRWRSPWAVSLFDAAGSPAALEAVFWAGAAALVAVVVGLATPVATLVAAVLFASLLHRGPMLAGPADDAIAILLWCLAVGRSGDALSLDALLAARRGRPRPPPSVRTRMALGLVKVHAAVIAAAAALAQLKGDVWWNGTAAWWLAARADSPVVDLTGAYLRSEYLMNLVTHAIVAFEIAFAAGVGIPSAWRVVVPAAVVGWPLVGLVAGEPTWGLALAVMSLACLPPPGPGRLYWRHA